MKRFFAPALAAGFLFASFPAVAASLVLDLNVNFDTAEELRPTVDQFREDLGSFSGAAPVNGDPNGRRQINWDAAPDAISDPNAFPGDFFNANVAPRARGIEFEATGGTTGFKLSATAASGQPVSFGFASDFPSFSPERLFAPIGGTTFDVRFFDPTNQAQQALTRGLGVVFVDVEEDYSTSMTFYDIYDNILATRQVKAGKNAGMSFAALAFDEAIVARVSIDAGDSYLLGNGHIGGSGDAVVMDDFIFGEPVAAAPVVPLPAALPALVSGLALFGFLRRRRS